MSIVNCNSDIFAKNVSVVTQVLKDSGTLEYTENALSQFPHVISETQYFDFVTQLSEIIRSNLLWRELGLDLDKPLISKEIIDDLLSFIFQEGEYEYSR